MKNLNYFQKDPSGMEVKRCITAVANMVRRPVTSLTENDVFDVDCALNAGHIPHIYAEVCFNHRRLFGWSYVLEAIHRKNSKG